VKTFLSDRLNLAWAISGLVLVAVLLLVPNDGLGTVVLILVAAVAIGLSGAARIRDAKRDRARRANDPRRRRR
jgi:VIT1/CCC1 family predicted Fe2+/Mn2+ transporter